MSNIDNKAGAYPGFFIEGAPNLQESTNIQFITFSKNT